jgi:hypothetical protein
MQLPASISNETEFQEWLAAAVEAERERLRKEVAERESRKCDSSEGFERETTKEPRLTR